MSEARIKCGHYGKGSMGSIMGSADKSGQQPGCSPRWWKHGVNDKTSREGSILLPLSIDPHIA